MGAGGISKSQVSRLCEEIDGKVKAFLERPIEGDWPYLWIDAAYLKVRRVGRIVSVAVIIAVGVDTDGRREVLGMEIGTSEAEPIWTEFLRKLTRRGVRGVKLVVSDARGLMIRKRRTELRDTIVVAQQLYGSSATWKEAWLTFPVRQRRPAG